MRGFHEQWKGMNLFLMARSISYLYIIFRAVRSCVYLHLNGFCNYHSLHNWDWDDFAIIKGSSRHRSNLPKHATSSEHKMNGKRSFFSPTLSVARTSSWWFSIMALLFDTQGYRSLKINISSQHPCTFTCLSKLLWTRVVRVCIRVRHRLGNFQNLWSPEGYATGAWYFWSVPYGKVLRWRAGSL